VDAVQIVERRPVLVGEAGNLERITGDHLEREMNAGLRPSDDADR
jgi:hypothetical protein